MALPFAFLPRRRWDDWNLLVQNVVFASSMLTLVDVRMSRIVSTRARGPGTWIITNDGWFTLGEPFDRPTPNGLRTIYPLTLQTTTLDVLRKGVSYELPPLRQMPPRHRDETSRAQKESE